MKLKHLKEWLENIPPEELEENNLVFRRILSDTGNGYMVSDTPVVSCGVDTETNEICFYDQKSHEIIKNQAIKN